MLWGDLHHQQCCHWHRQHFHQHIITYFSSVRFDNMKLSTPYVKKWRSVMYNVHRTTHFKWNSLAFTPVKSALRITPTHPTSPPRLLSIALVPCVTGKESKTQNGKIPTSLFTQKGATPFSFVCFGCTGAKTALLTETRLHTVLPRPQSFQATL